MHRHIYDRLRSTLQPFVDDYKSLLQTMDTTGSVISGSQATAFMQSSFPDWTPNDLDIYTSRTQYNALRSFLEKNKYEAIDPDLVLNVPTPYPKTFGIWKVVKMKRGPCSIDIIISASTLAIVPIFYFHSTVVMNFIAAHGYFSAYPQLNNQNRAILNANAFTPTNPLTTKQ